jgi:hypothetical protein
MLHRIFAGAALLFLPALAANNTTNATYFAPAIDDDLPNILTLAQFNKILHTEAHNKYDNEHSWRQRHLSLMQNTNTNASFVLCDTTFGDTQRLATIKRYLGTGDIMVSLLFVCCSRRVFRWITLLGLTSCSIFSPSTARLQQSRYDMCCSSRPYSHDGKQSSWRPSRHGHECRHENGARYP